MEKITYCADAIAFYEESGKIVLVERLGSVKGLALPGGKQDPGESLTQAVVREVLEETGLCFTPESVFVTCAEAGRDPRGRYVSTIFVGKATGTIKEEERKTKVTLLDPKKFEEIRHGFVFDHGNIIASFLR